VPCRYLDVIVDLSRAAEMTDFRPSRLALMASASPSHHGLPESQPDPEPVPDHVTDDPIFRQAGGLQHVMFGGASFQPAATVQC
jgi:hypothetical protein